LARSRKYKKKLILPTGGAKAGRKGTKPEEPRRIWELRWLDLRENRHPSLLEIEKNHQRERKDDLQKNGKRGLYYASSSRKKREKLGSVSSLASYWRGETTTLGERRHFAGKRMEHHLGPAQKKGWERTEGI